MESIFKFLITKPKTYIPLLVIGFTWLADLIIQSLNIPISINETFKESFTVICLVIAIALLRRGAIKEKDIEKIREALIMEIEGASNNPHTTEDEAISENEATEILPYDEENIPKL